MSEQQELQPVFSIEKIYVKDLSLEIQKNRDDIQYNRQKIAVLEAKLGQK